MKLSLVVLTPGPGKGKVISINETPFFIGRDSGCHLRPRSNHISKRHCALLRRGDKAYVLDFDSTNGTFVNDRQVKGGIELLNGDRLRVGPLLFIVYMDTVPVDMPTPIPATRATPLKQTSGQAVSPSAKKAPCAADDDESATALMSGQDSDVSEDGPRAEVPEGSRLRDRFAGT